VWATRHRCCRQAATGGTVAGLAAAAGIEVAVAAAPGSVGAAGVVEGDLDADVDGDLDADVDGVDGAGRAPGCDAVLLPQAAITPSASTTTPDRRRDLDRRAPQVDSMRPHFPPPVAGGSTIVRSGVCGIGRSTETMTGVERCFFTANTALNRYSGA
jgi:hypothetical protein